MARYSSESLIAQQPEQLALQRVFIQNVYAWMTGGLLLTALAAWTTLVVPELFELTLSLRWVLAIVTIGLVAFLSFRVETLSPRTAIALFLLYAALTGMTLSILFYVYTADSIANTFVVTAATFAVTALYGYTTQRDLSGVGSFLFMGLIGLIIATIVNLFLQSSALSFAVSVVGVIVFVGLTAYDMQRIKELSINVITEGKKPTNYAIIAALALYLDFLNLFLYLLRFLGRRR